MFDLISNTPLLITFLGASLVLAVTPGPGVFYIVARSVTQGRRFGLASVAGVAAGNWCNAIGASVGLAALFAVSDRAFLVVKLAGAAYLVYLGARTMRSPSSTHAVDRTSAVSASKIFRDGFIVALLNPKTAVFFAAFLPQFMSADSNPMAQGVFLGSLFVVLAGITDSAYALAAGSISGVMARSAAVQRCGRTSGGAALIGLGVFTALGGNRSRS